MNLKDKKIFITGGTGGIGTPLVKKLKDAGAIVDIHDIEIHGDLVENIEKFTNKLRSNAPDILINMAGFNAFDYCENQNADKLINLNLIVPIKLSQAVLPEMKKRNSGKIVNISSMTALIPLPHYSIYVASKAGLKAFSDSLRREVADTNIIITNIIPRAVKTAMNVGKQDQANKKSGVKYDSPEKIAAKIFNAISADKSEVRFGFPERIFAVINSLFPSIIDKGLTKTRKVQEEILNNDN